MGKKRPRQQSSNGVVTEESSESDGSQNHDKPQNAARQCSHANKSVDFNQVRKNLNLEDIANNNFCQECSKGNQIKDGEIYVCLRCGVKSCSIEHSREHFYKPHSDSHMLALNLSSKTVWCHGCKLNIDVGSNKKLNSCFSGVESMFEKHMKGPINKSSPKIESIVEENCVENKLQAVPILPPKNKFDNVIGVKGLRNLGNTCFFNSVLQCLAQTPNLIESLREMENNKEVSIPLNDGRILSGQLLGQDNFAEELAETLSKIREGGQPYNPMKLLAMLRKKVPQFKGNDQHDSHELLRHLLDSVRCSDLKRYRKLLLDELGLNGVENDKVDPEKQKELKQLDREMTDKTMFIPDQVFRGFLVSRLQCQECYHSSECVESFLDLSLPVSSEKPHPPLRKKGHEEKHLSKHQLRKLERKKNHGKHHHEKNHRKNEAGQGEAVFPITEKGESDVDGDDGDVDSEESYKKTEARTDNCPKEELLCAGISIPAAKVARLHANIFNSSARSSVEVDFRPNGWIPLTEEGVPDISNLAINDSSQPQLKSFIRDAETIAKEDPSWLTNLHKHPELPENGNLPNFNELSGIANSKQPKNINETSPGGNSEKSEKDELAMNQTVINDNSGVVQESWLNDQRESLLNEISESDELVHHPPIEPVLSPSPDIVNSNNDDGANSDDDVMVGTLFEENNAADSSGECSIQSCLSQFTGIELMTGSNKVGCETCTAKENGGKKDKKTVYTMSTKQLLISEAPPILILHIKRFQVQMSSFRKLSRHVAFPLELDISPFCKKETVKKSPEKLKYSLYGIVEHSGNFSGGHYVAYVKVEDHWFCVSDSYVNEVKESRVLQAQAYLLFYKSS